MCASASPSPRQLRPPKPYSFQYGVEDPESKASFQASESQDTAGSVGGEYRVALPDGRLQTVKYSVDPASGYIAQVTYSEDACIPHYGESTSTQPQNRRQQNTNQVMKHWIDMCHSPIIFIYYLFI